MPIPLLIPIVAGIAANFMGGRAAAQRQQLMFNRKEELASEKAFMKVLDDLSQGKRGAHDVNAIKGLESQIKGLPGGADLYDTVLSSATAGHLHAQSMQGIVQSLFGSGQGQEGVPPATGGGNPGSPPLAGSPAPTAAAQDLPAVSGQIADLNARTAALPTFDPQRKRLVDQRESLVNSESQLTGEMLNNKLGSPDTVHYDYAAAQKAGAIAGVDPNEKEIDPATGKPFLHFDSRFKFDTHPHRFIQSELGIFDSKYSRIVPEDEFNKTATLGQKQRMETSEVLPADEVRGYLEEARVHPQFQPLPGTQTLRGELKDQGFPKLPGILKMPGITTVTIPKDMFGVEIHGSRAEALNGVIGQARQRGFTSHEIYTNLKQQGIEPPEALSHQAYNEFAGKYLTSEEFLKNPRKALQEIASNFPSEDPKALVSFGQQAFTSAYIGAKERLRKTGMYVSDRALSQAAFSEATGAVGSEFVPESVLQDVDRSKASTTDNLMVELLDKALTGDKAAMAQYGIMLQMNAGKIASEEAARRLAAIRTEQGAAFIQPETLKDIQGKDGKPLPFGTTQAQAAGTQIIPPEVQAQRTQRSTEIDKMQFVAQRAIPIMQGAQARVLDLVGKVEASGFVGKVGALGGLPSSLGQELDGYDKYRVKFIGNLRSLAGETAGVITDKDIDRFASLFPEGKDFVTLLTNRSEQLIKNFSEMEAVLSDRLGQEVHPFADIIGKLKTSKHTHNTFEQTLSDFDKAVKGLGKK